MVLERQMLSTGDNCLWPTGVMSVHTRYHPRVLLVFNRI